MRNTSYERLREREIGIASECSLLGLVAFLTLGSFLLVIGNTLPRSLLGGTVLGVTVGGFRYLLRVVVARLQHLLSKLKA